MTLVEKVRKYAFEQPDKVAFHYNGQDTTYLEFEKLCGQFASSLQKLGIRKGDHVAFLLGNTPEFLISLYATMRIGAVAIPINPIYTKDEIAFILQNGDAKVVIAMDTVLPLVEYFPQVELFIICDSSSDLSAKVSKLPNETEKKIRLFSEVLNSNTSVESVEVEESDTAIILYTSGTTGHPKGAMLSHRNLYSNARDVAKHVNFSSDDRVIATLPLFHVFALTVALNAPILKGATVLLVQKFSPRTVFELADSQKATVFAGVPTMFNFLYQFEDGNPAQFKNLRLVISGGAPLPVKIIHQFKDKFGVLISEGYGLSEASPVTCINPIDSICKPGSIGISIPNVENKIVNEDGFEVPVGEVGELIVRGPNIMKGYYKLPDETKKSIRNGWLYTGDLAKKDEDDYFYIIDRKKDLIIVGGFNVYPREVEEVLFSHPNVLEAAVIGCPDEDYGELVFAYVVLKEKNTTQKQLFEYCAEHLAKYKLPIKIEILEELPKNSTGKVLRRTLKDYLERLISTQNR